MNNAIVEVAQPVKVLTIAGSDSGGAAGLQADLKTFTLLGVYGMSVVTAVTAQNSLAVTAVHHLPADFVAAQLDAVLSDYGAAAVKTGFIGREELVEIIADRLAAYATPNRLVDPILVNHRGESMFGSAITDAYRRHLLPTGRPADTQPARSGTTAQPPGHDPVRSGRGGAPAGRSGRQSGLDQKLARGGRTGRSAVRQPYRPLFSRRAH
jgi:hydroxymethylpyrimidine/phosphomethylpyrimidine kinase